MGEKSKAAGMAAAGITIGTMLSGCNTDTALQERVVALEAKLAAAEQRIVLLEDADEIRNLNRIYGYYLDKALYDQLLDLFTDDISLEYSQRGVYLGKERARQLMTMMPGGKG